MQRTTQPAIPADARRWPEIAGSPSGPHFGALAPVAPPVSIVVRTCRGRLDFLQESLASLCAQSYPALEIVVVEDGSNAAGQLVERVATRSSRKIVYRPIAKAGRCRAGNLGLSLASGRLLGFLDDDDRLFPDHVASLVDVLLREPGAPAAYSLACEVPTRLVSSEPLCYQERARYVVHRRRWQAAELAGRNFLPIQSVLFRRELFQRYGGLDESLECLEDWDLWRRYLAAGKFIHVDRVTSMHRVPADAGEAHARYRRIQAYRPTFELKWSAAAGPRSAAAEPGIVRRLAGRAILHPLPFRLYWHARIWWYSRRERRSGFPAFAA
jgi:glycosyltransferase involved in cell wall biosynthesis